MSIYIKVCEKCGKAFDMLSCPYCNKKRIDEIWKKKK